MILILIFNRRNFDINHFNYRVYQLFIYNRTGFLNLYAEQVNSSVLHNLIESKVSSTYNTKFIEIFMQAHFRQFFYYIFMVNFLELKEFWKNTFNFKILTNKKSVYCLSSHYEMLHIFQHLRSIKNFTMTQSSRNDSTDYYLQPTSKFYELMRLS